MNRGNRAGAGGSPELEEALVDRLRQLEWPRPTAEVKQRCLNDIVDRMAEMKREEPKERGRLEFRRIRGRGEQHPLTRHAVALSHRQPLRAFERPVRLASVLR
jgi:hypothetical protein